MIGAPAIWDRPAPLPGQFWLRETENALPGATGKAYRTPGRRVAGEGRRPRRLRRGREQRG
jgi:hypothetical protein